MEQLPRGICLLVLVFQLKKMIKEKKDAKEKAQKGWFGGWFGGGAKPDDKKAPLVSQDEAMQMR